MGIFDNTKKILTNAIAQGNTETDKTSNIIPEIISNFANNFSKNKKATNEKQISPDIVKAIENKSIDKIQEIIDSNKDLDINAVDLDGKTALILAVINKEDKIVDLLLTDHIYKDRKIIADINIKDKYGKTALSYSEGTIRKLLYESGAKYIAQDNSLSQENKAVEKTLSNTQNIKVKDKYGKTALGYSEGRIKKTPEDKNLRQENKAVEELNKVIRTNLIDKVTEARKAENLDDFKKLFEEEKEILEEKDVDMIMVAIKTKERIYSDLIINTEDNLKNHQYTKFRNQLTELAETIKKYSQELGTPTPNNNQITPMQKVDSIATLNFFTRMYYTIAMYYYGGYEKSSNMTGISDKFKLFLKQEEVGTPLTVKSNAAKSQELLETLPVTSQSSNNSIKTTEANINAPDIGRR